MTETIQVVYSPIDGFGSAYHETLVYTTTNADGTPRYLALSAGPASAPTGSNGLASAVIQGESPASGTSPFGNLQAPPPVDVTNNLSGIFGNHSAVTVASGSDLSGQWAKAVQAFADIDAAHFAYGALTQNSNSAASTALTAAGITLPNDTSVYDDHWAPGASHILGIPGVTPSDTYNPMIFGDSNGNPTIQITESDGDGTTATVDLAQTNTDSYRLTYTALNGSGQLVKSGLSYQVAGRDDIMSDVSQYDPISGTESQDEVTQSSLSGQMEDRIDVSGSGVNTAVDGDTSANFSGTDLTISELGSGLSVSAVGAGNTINAFGSGEVFTLSGGSATVNSGCGGNSIALSNGGNYVVNASSDTITAADNVNATINGTGDMVGASGSNESLTLNGGGDTVNSGNGGNYFSLNNGGDYTVNASNDAIGSSDYVSATINGTGDTVGASGSNESLSLNGGNDTVNSGNGGNYFSLNNGGSYTVNASNDAIGSSDYVSATINGTGDTVGASGSNESLSLNGGSDTVNSGNGGNYFSLNNGGNYTVNAYNDAIGSSDYVSATINGTGDTVGASGSHESLTLNDGSDTINAGNGGNYFSLNNGGNYIVNASNESIGTGDYVNGVINGTGDTVSADGSHESLTLNDGNDIVNSVNGGNYISLNNGGNYTVNANYDSVATGDYVSGTINGMGDMIGANGSYESLTLNGGSDTINLGSYDYVGLNNGGGYIVNAYNSQNDAIAAGAYVNGSINGSNDNIYDNSFADNITVSGNADNIYAGSSSFTSVFGSSDTVYAVGGAIGITGYSDLANVSNTNVYEGSNTSLNVSGNSDVVSAGQSDATGIFGNNNSLNSSSGTASFTGAGDTGNLSGVSVALGDNTTLSVAGNNDTFNMGSGDQLGVRGGANLVNSGSSDHTSLVGNSDTYTGYGSNDYLGITGYGETIDTSGENISIGGNTSGVINGDHDTIADPGTDSFSIYGSYDGVWGSSSGMSFGAGGTGDYDNSSQDPYGYDPGDGEFDFDPVILNLSGGSVQTQGLDASSVRFDMLNDGTTVQTGWMSAGEGVLVYDPSDMPITKDDQFIGGLAELDSMAGSKTGELDASNPLFDELRVWVDPTGNAQFAQADLHTLSDLGIASINLDYSLEGADSNGNLINADSNFTRIDGSKGDIAGVDLAYASQNPASNSNSASTSTVWTLDESTTTGLSSPGEATGSSLASPSTLPAGLDLSAVENTLMPPGAANTAVLTAHAA